MMFKGIAGGVNDEGSKVKRLMQTDCHPLHVMPTGGRGMRPLIISETAPSGAGWICRDLLQWAPNTVFCPSAGNSRGYNVGTKGYHVLLRGAV
jgi:hypothetical protein